jgi:hypothetical protein
MYGSLKYIQVQGKEFHVRLDIVSTDVRWQEAKLTLSRRNSWQTACAIFIL